MHPSSEYVLLSLVVVVVVLFLEYNRGDLFIHRLPKVG